MSFRTIYGNTYSEAGWRMCNRDECVLVPGPFMNTAPLRKGAPAIILGDFINRYHNEIAPIVSPVWGWSATNDVANSNHLAGVALDLNAPQWPWGGDNVPLWLEKKTDALINYYEGTVFWGNYWNYQDEMHFQIGVPEGHESLARVVKKIQNRNNNVKDEPVSWFTDKIKSAIDGKEYPASFMLGAIDYHVNRLNQRVTSLIDSKKSFTPTEIFALIDKHTYETNEAIKKMGQNQSEIIDLLTKLVNK